jgi:hypothetical protein
LGDVDDEDEDSIGLSPLWINEQPSHHYDRGQVDDWEKFEAEQTEKKRKQAYGCQLQG